MTDDRGRNADIVGGTHEGLGNSWDSTSDAGDGSSRAEMGGRAQSATWSAASHQGYFIDGAEAFAAVAVHRWLDIASARAGQRVVVGGSHLTGDGVGSYWWQAEDVIGADGRPVGHPTATHWRQGSV